MLYHDFYLVVTDEHVKALVQTPHPGQSEGVSEHESQYDHMERSQPLKLIQSTDDTHSPGYHRELQHEHL